MAVQKGEKSNGVGCMCVPLCWCVSVRERAVMKHGWWAVCMQGPWGSERQLAVQSLLVFRLQGLVHSSRAKEAPLLAPEVLTLMSSFLGSFLLGHGGQRVNGVSLHLKESPESLTGAQPLLSSWSS